MGEFDAHACADRALFLIRDCDEEYRKQKITEKTIKFSTILWVVSGLILALIIPSILLSIFGIYIAGILPKIVILLIFGWAAYRSYRRESSQSSTSNAKSLGRGLLLAVVGAGIGLGVGYLTSPVKPGSVFLTQGQADYAAQVGGTHLLIATAIGLLLGLVLHFLIPKQKG